MECGDLAPLFSGQPRLPVIREPRLAKQSGAESPHSKKECTLCVVDADTDSDPDFDFPGTFIVPKGVKNQWEVRTRKMRIAGTLANPLDYFAANSYGERNL